MDSVPVSPSMTPPKDFSPSPASSWSWFQFTIFTVLSLIVTVILGYQLITHFLL